MRLVSALLVKDEADRYLRRVIARCQEFSDKVLVLDDGSTDDTARVAKEMGCLVKQRSQPGAWGNEAPARAELWDRAAKCAGPDGWVLFCDADMLLVGDPRPLCRSWDVNAWAFVLYDLWSETEYRSDGFWKAHEHPRPWLVRPGASWAEYSAFVGRGIHAGHIPPGFPLHPAVAPQDAYHWLHLAYCKKPDRLLKFERYKTVWSQLNEFEQRHAASIIDGDSHVGAAP